MEVLRVDSYLKIGQKDMKLAININGDFPFDTDDLGHCVVDDYGVPCHGPNSEFRDKIEFLKPRVPHHSKKL